MASSRTGKLVILSGPSGSGKTTVVRKLLGVAEPRLELSVSATTRPPRAGEVDGKDYHFLTTEEFLRRKAAGEFLETFEVFGNGYWYGTLRSEVERRLADGISVLLEIDVDGAMEIVKQYPSAVTIFLSPGTEEELERRLRGRKTESEETIQRRLATAKREMAAMNKYKYQIVNDAGAVNETVQRLADVIQNDSGDDAL
ncbi:guanylate kinase [Blastopirellula sp. JC732]|uniref:Guanylate kinase n=1 Tax=Blastopirellula sediminis TaxID=2894196 RepID=A0A9X1SFR2_9BACT|nr:guanylate kinase [Blastopirellula sediminis]MCC9609191.1 guanylate kinase [Blastopirellula sediminis]MCC9628032.1 guanylate kinase [Blastopirellula sediminis]